MNSAFSSEVSAEKLSYDAFRDQVLADYRLACESREASLMGRKEVLTGKAKFGIFGDGKELPQVAMARFFRPGDSYSGYYRDQTFAFASGTATVTEFFSQLYSDPDTANDPHSAGRQMNSHFASANVDESGQPLDLVNHKLIAAGMAPTAAQMPRAVGLALASKLFRASEALQDLTHLSHHGNEVCFCTIGDASTSEGHFWETMNAAAVQQIPLAVFVWDDGYGISVPIRYQTTKGSISEALRGFERNETSNGIHIYTVSAWDYAGMCEAFEEGIRLAREEHIPVLFHVQEVTQPQGHSTSGSHERYKTPERLEWERKWDCNRKMREWILENLLASDEELVELEQAAKKYVRECRDEAWRKYFEPIRQQRHHVLAILDEMIPQLQDPQPVQQLVNELRSNKEPLRRDLLRSLSRSIELTPEHIHASARNLLIRLDEENRRLYNSHLHLEGPGSALQVGTAEPLYDQDAPHLNAYEVLNRYFDALFTANPAVVAFGEDVGKIGDVNQGFAGLQEKFGEYRIFDTGIRELTIIGQGIGMAMRGLRPIAEIQYLDYVIYGLQPLTDDVATLRFRTAGRQAAPLIVRTRGHRLEGIWHSGSPMGVLIHALRGMHLCVPRNMVQAAGMYNTLLDSAEPGMVIESLNGYRLKERLPNNLLEMRVPLGIPEIVREGTDITLVTYGSTVRIVLEAADFLEKLGISCEVIDVQTLLPFDIHHQILESLKRTNRIAFVDEDVPGGAAAYMFNKVMEEQGGYQWLDAKPRTLTAQAHRPAYGSDGDYFSKPNAENVIRLVREMMAE
jgi:pyruvate/2-oxoglutarate/acetoin dehydrogenase E1 component/TPP-dependent pyruvate/acetoin dehydrogenase alpha subunit